MQKSTGKTHHKLHIFAQVLVEYVIMLVLLAIIAMSCLLLFSTFSEYGTNVRKQISIDSP